MSRQKDFLLFTEFPHVKYATNTFINVPVILQYESTPLIEVFRKGRVNFTNQITIFHPDGTKLAVVKGPRIYSTKGGKKANLQIREFAEKRVCELDGRTLFELSRTSQGWEVESELYTPDGMFVKAGAGTSPSLLSPGNEEPLKIGGMTMINRTIQGSKIGILINKDGIAIGVNR